MGSEAEYHRERKVGIVGKLLLAILAFLADKRDSLKLAKPELGNAKR